MKVLRLLLLIKLTIYQFHFYLKPKIKNILFPFCFLLKILIDSSQLGLFYPSKSNTLEFAMLFGGTLQGHVKAFTYPLIHSSGDSQVAALKDIQLHGGSLN